MGPPWLVFGRSFMQRLGRAAIRRGAHPSSVYGFELCEVAKRAGGGWVGYVWPRPGSAEPARKVSYVLSVPGRSYQVGAGGYDDDLTLAERAPYEKVASRWL